jgi:hypothetical protein
VRDGESVVIDANIIMGVYQDSRGKDHDLTDSPTGFIDDLIDNNCRVAVDAGGQIIQEWRDCVDPDWFEFWYFDFVERSHVAKVSVMDCREILKKLYTECGFLCNENAWLVRTAVTEASRNRGCVLATEDVDFFEPSAKANAAHRKRHLEGRVTGRVTKLLKRHGVEVLALCCC